MSPIYTLIERAIFSSPAITFAHIVIAYKRLMIQDVQQIACADERYAQVNDQDDAPVVVAIIVQGQE